MNLVSKPNIFCMAACGEEHTLCLTVEGDLYSFGNNSNARLGYIGEKSAVPKHISCLQRIRHVSCGSTFSACVDWEGKLWIFGSINRCINAVKPYEMKGLPPLLHATCGGEFVIALARDQTVWSFGSNYSGQIGLGDILHQKTPRQIQDLSNIIQVACGSGHTLFLCESGDLYACGDSKSGSTGLGESVECVKTPTIIPGLPEIASIACGFSHSCILDIDGLVYTTGKNIHGQLGRVNDEKQVFTFHQVTAITSSVIMISAGRHQTYCVTLDGMLWSFGYNGNGELGNGSCQSSHVPKPVASVKDIVYIAPSSMANHVIVKDSQTKVWCFGFNNKGQLGLGDFNARLSPEELIIEGVNEIVPTNQTSQRAKSARK